MFESRRARHFFPGKLRKETERFGVALRNCEENVENLRKRVALDVQRDGQTFAEMIRAITKSVKKSCDGNCAIAAAA